jgi:3-deoxy-D-manno-octulosonate 8-phosphate phosphatase (KDO 8-P phosphatase)
MIVSEELAARAKKIKAILTDVDGVLTDGGLIIGPGGEEWKIFDVRDGSAAYAAQRSGIRVAFISGRRSPVVDRRARELGVDLVYQGMAKKTEALDDLKQKLGLGDDEFAYLGDDLIDLPVMKRVGLAVAVADCRPELRRVAHVVTEAPGGRGAFRELVDWLLQVQGRWADILGYYGV